MKKRLFAILLTVFMIASLLPTGALAYVGAKWDTGGAQEFYSDGGRFVMENDYIYFSVFNTSPDFLELKAKNDTSAGHSGINLEFFVEYPGQEKREMNIESATLKTDGAQNSGMVTAVFTFGNDHYQTPGDVEMTYTVDYKLVRLDEGSTGSGTVTEPIMQVQSGDGTTWALFADGEFEFEGEALPVFAGDDHAEVSVRASLLWFSNFGHPEYDGEVPVAPVMISKADRDYSGPVTTDYNTTNISQGLGWTATNPDENDSDYYITEVFVDSYAYANPFVATSQFYDYFDTYGTDNDQGVWGFDSVRFPTDIYYERDDDFGSNYAYSCLMVETSAQFHEPNDPQTADLLIGYRDLINTQEDELPTDPDEITISSSADRLAVYADGTVTPYDGSSGISGNPVAIIRGDFELSNGAYNFTGGAAALSPTVTATWSGSGSYFRIKTDGTVEQNGVHLNAPSFKFYLPQSGHTGDLKLNFNADGLQMSNMGNNDAVLNIDIPGASTTVQSGTATAAGGLTFNGQLSFNNMFSQESLNMTELSYALKNGVFTVNGVKASGTFDSVSLLGFTLGEVSGSIDTFTNTYDFEANINVFSLLEASGALQLKRTNSGELMPNNLYFEVDSKVGIPLVPPAPVVKLTGGGAGFSGLADTANGDWYAIPPLKFRGSVDANIVEFLKADGANIVLGPSEFELSVEALEIAGTNFAAFSGGIGMYLGGDKMTYRNEEYSGLAASGRIWLDIDLPSQSLNFLVFDGEMAAGIFGGMNGNNLYLKGYGNSHASAALQFPDSWPLVGGWNLLGVGVDTAVAAETLIQGSSDYGDTIESAFNNLDLQLGLAATGSFLGSDVRVWVILPDVAQRSDEDWNWGWDFKFWGSLGRWSWDGTAMGSSSSSNASAVRTASSSNGTTTASKTIEVSGVDDEETAYLVLSFQENTAIDLSKVNVTKSGGDSFSFTPVQIAVDENDSITNADEANIMSGVMPLADGSGNEQVLIIKLGEGSSYNGTYTVSLGNGTDEIQPAYSTANVVAPADGLGAMGVNDSGNIEVEVEYPEEGTNYILRTYLGTGPLGTDYMVDERAVENLDADGEMSFNIPTRGTAAPTGDYYVTSYLLKEISYIPEGAAEPETAYVAIDYAGVSDTRVGYTNTMSPAGAPQEVTLEANGNETMVASWKAPSAAANVDGYKITIYEQEGENWVDTGFGYEYDASQFVSTNADYISGLSVSDDGTYSIDMAMTVGGELEAGKSYKVGVSAYNSETVTIGDETQNVKYYGQEAQNSVGVLLPEYEPLDMTMQYKATGADWVELSADTETGIYNLGVRQGSNTSLGLIRLSDNENAFYTVTRMDDSSQITVDTYNEFYVPDFEGMLMLQITGSVKNNGITDTTTRYLLISRDETAPIITLDAGIFYVDESGNYTVTGVTEPGARITSNAGEYGSYVTADENGKFSIAGTLTSENSTLLVVTATDTAGNEGTDDAVVTRAPSVTDEPDEPDVPTTPTDPDEPDDGGLPFTDVRPSDWFHENVVYVYENGLMNGTSDTLFTPYGTVTRGMIVTILHRLEGEPESGYDMPFTDVAEGQWYTEAIRWAAGEGIVNGVSDTAFAPNDPITREQFAAILWRYAKSKGYDVSIGESTNILSYSDFDEISEYAIEAMQWACGAGIISGRGGGILDPRGTASRAEAAAMLMRFVEL